MGKRRIDTATLARNAFEVTGRRETVAQSEWHGRNWDLNVDLSDLTVASKGAVLTVKSEDAASLTVRRRFFRWSLRGQQFDPIALPGLRRSDAANLKNAIQRLSISRKLAGAVRWHDSVTTKLNVHIRGQRWIPRETIEQLNGTQPDGALLDAIRYFKCMDLLSEEELLAASFVDVDLNLICGLVNQWILGAELQTESTFLESIEKSPLTEEQARAVLTFDNRVHVLAAAGSGKTSVMVARAGYAVKKGIVTPDRILVLAFNKAAALELQDRITERFEAAGINASGLKASTFHAFGLRVIGEATGKKPRLASFLDQGQDIKMILEIVHELRDSSPVFRYQWDLYRLLFSNIPNDIEGGTPDGHAKATSTRPSRVGFQTFGGEIVKSEGERMIANFLFLGGVEYEYEREYSIDVADATHSQYRPDFYYPSADLWHEHWALDQNGIPPSSFDGYAESKEWKKKIHALCETSLIETTWEGIMHGDGLEQLRVDLESHGIAFDWNPDRPIANQWARPLDHEQLARFIRSFMSHVKSNDWSRADLEGKLNSEAMHLDNERTRRFLSLYWKIHRSWDERLKKESAVDFEDMLVQAARHLQAGLGDLGYDLVMVDEFQDASQARALLVQGLLKQPNRYLLAVGDDWQSINRFAGADVSIVQDFEKWFGTGPQLSLTKTFRCTQAISDSARDFIIKNPSQLVKKMESIQKQTGIPIKIIQTPNTGSAIAAYLTRLSKQVEDQGNAPDTAPCTVDILGRFNHQRDLLPEDLPENLKVRFRTVHSSKGLEADYIIVLGMSTGRYGFPSGITDDPILQLAMPKPEDFPHAEERRLFYVALTRARKGVTLIGPPGNLSPFLLELMPDEEHADAARSETVAVEGGISITICPECRAGTLVELQGPNGRFLACSTFPACTATLSLKPSPAIAKREDT